jgi:hypothetical protein
MINKALHEAADALRRHEQSEKKLKEWYQISHGQRSRWLAKATVVLEAYRAAQAAKDKAA